MILEAFAFKLLNLYYENIFSVVISSLFMTSLSISPHYQEVVSSAKFAKSELYSSKKSQRYMSTQLRISLSRAAHGWGVGKKTPSLKSVTRSTVMKFGTIIPYVEKMRKTYKSRYTLLEFCWHQHLSPKISNFCQEILI